jgi:hypothetical protein
VALPVVAGTVTFAPLKINSCSKQLEKHAERQEVVQGIRTHSGTARHAEAFAKETNTSNAGTEELGYDSNETIKTRRAKTDAHSDG